jgi:hypothetical protein
MEEQKELIKQVIQEEVGRLFSNHFANGVLVALFSVWLLPPPASLAPFLLVLAFKIGWDVAYYREIFPKDLALMFAGGLAVILAANL